MHSSNSEYVRCVYRHCGRDESALRAGWSDITGVDQYDDADLSTVWLAASVAEKRSGADVRWSDSAYRSQRLRQPRIRWQVKYIGDLLDPTRAQRAFRVAIDNRSGLFKPGMFARVSFSGPAHSALLVGIYRKRPLHAVFVEQAPFRS